MMVVVSGRMKGAPAVSVPVLGPPTSGVDHSGIRDRPPAVAQAIRPFTTALTTAVTAMALITIQRRCEALMPEAAEFGPPPRRSPVTDGSPARPAATVRARRSAAWHPGLPPRRPRPRPVDAPDRPGRWTRPR